jgi:hypothetical protein
VGAEAFTWLLDELPADAEPATRRQCELLRAAVVEVHEADLEAFVEPLPVVSVGPSESRR